MRPHEIKKILKNIISYIDFKELIINKINNVNIANEENIRSKYDLYLSLLNNLEISIYNEKLLGFSNNRFSHEYFLSRGHSLSESASILNKSHKKSAETLKRRDDYIEIKKKYGKSNDYKNYLNKINLNTNKKYTTHDAKAFIFKKQSNAAKASWSKNPNRSTCWQTKYYIERGYSFVDALSMAASKRWEGTLKSYIEKYGFNIGLINFKKRQDKWQSTLNNKPEEEKLQIYLKKIKSLSNNIFSKESFKIFHDIEKNINEVMFYGKNEKTLYNHKLKRVYFYDCMLPTNKIIIEYNGSHCHPNKSKLSKNEWDNWRNIYDKTQNAEIKHNIDLEKQLLAEELGYTYYIIWDTDNISIKIKTIIDAINKK